MLTPSSRTHQQNEDKQNRLTPSWECTNFAVVPPWPKLFFSYVSFPASSIGGLLLGTLRRRGDERELVSGEHQHRMGRPCALSALTPAAARHLWDEASPEWDDELGPLVHVHPRS